MIEFDDSITPLASGRSLLLHVPAGAVERDGIFFLPEKAHGLVILAQGIEDQARLARQHALKLAEALQQKQLATFVVDLFNSEEQILDQQSAYFRNNADIMQQRLIAIAEWFQEEPATGDFSIGYFGNDTTTAATLIAATERPDLATAIVAVGGDLTQARDHLARVQTPTLLIAAEKDDQETTHFQEALASLPGEKELVQVQGVTNLYTDDALSTIIQHATSWFAKHLIPII